MGTDCGTLMRMRSGVVTAGILISLWCSFTFAGSSEPAEKQGTCFAVSPDGLVLTAYHVIKGAAAVSVAFPGKEPANAEVVRTSPSNDLALLRVPFPLGTFLPLAERRSISVGDQVFTMGFPALDILGTEPKYTDGAISSLSGLAGEASLLQVTVPIQPGNSGGPLVNERGQVVGVVTSTASNLPFFAATGTFPQNVNWAISADYAAPLLDALSPLEPAQTRKEAISRTQQSICLVVAMYPPLPNQPISGRIAGTWKVLQSGRTLSLTSDDTHIYVSGHISYPNGEWVQTTYEVTRQEDGTFIGSILGRWSCEYSDLGDVLLGGYSEMTCPLRREVRLTRVTEDRIEGEVLLQAQPDPSTRAYRKFCKTCGNSVEARWYSFVWIRAESR
jgi:hypothetical protein